MSLTAGSGQRPRDNRDMARGARLLEHDAAQARPVVVEQRRRAHRAGDENRALRQFLGQEDEALAGELMQETVGDVGQIVQPVAQIGIGLALQLGARVVLHPLDRRLGGEARTHRLAQPAQPAAIVRDHAEGFEHVAVLAGLAVVGAIDEVVDRGAHRADRRLEPLQLRIDVVGDDLRHGDARLVHDHMAEPEPVGDAQTFQRHRPAHGDRRALASAMLCNSPEAIISASSIAVVCSASTSSSE